MPNLSMEDAELLAAAHWDLLTAMSEGVTVLGRADRPDLIHAAHTMQATVPVAALPLITHDQAMAAA